MSAMSEQQRENLTAAAWVLTVAIFVLATIGAVVGIAL
jgi:hypothetical protein